MDHMPNFTNIEKISEQIDLLLCIEDEIIKGAKGGFCCKHYIAEKVSILMKSLEIEME